MLDPDGLPISLLREADGSALKVQVGLPGGRHLVAQVWKAQVGRVPLLLLDSDVEDNEPAERDVTDRLYGGGSEHRLLQEMLLGIGGVRALRAYCRLTGAPAPEVFHTNEGHAGFLGVERIRELIEEHGLTFDEARRGGPRGHRVHHAHPGSCRHRPVREASSSRSTSAATTASPASRSSGCSPSVPRTTTAATRASSTWPSWACGSPSAPTASPSCTVTSAREMFSRLWPGFDEPEVPIGYITNGVHAPTWVAPEVLRDGRPGDRSTSPTRPRVLGRRDPGPGRRHLGDPRTAARPAGGRRPAPGPALLGAARCQRGRAGLGRQDPRPGRPHHRLRPPGAVVQAAHADAARPGAADGACCVTRSGRSRSSSPARRTRPTTAARS